MKSILKFLLILSLIITSIVSVIAIKVEPTMSDTELLMMVQATTKQQNQDNLTINNINNKTKTPESIASEIFITEDKNDNLNNSEKQPEVLVTETIMCQHTNTSTTIINSTCTKNGKNTTICNDCNEKINEEIITKLDHKPITITIEATCKNNGEIRTICSVCNTILSTKTTAKGCHTDLILLKEIEPTPLADGYRIHKCSYCNEEIVVTLQFWQNGEVNLYIPSVGINCEVNLGECNQTNTDKFDVTCDMNFINNNNPLFFGHNTRTLGRLYKVKVGDLIYFTINGETAIYKVIISEEGDLINGGIDIQGKETGTSCIAPCNKNTLHFFTCYSTIFNYNSRWIVLAEKV